MKLKRLVSAGAAGAFALSLAAPSSANIITVTFQGIVISGADLTGVFGAPGTDLTGDKYTAVYTVDDSTTAFHDYTPDSLMHLLGGSADGRGSPVSATLTINGHTASLPGTYLGNAWHGWRSIGGGEEYYYAQDYATVGSVTYKDFMDNQIFSYVNPVTASWDLYAQNPYSYTVNPGDHTDGSFYDYVVQNTDTGVYLVNVTANLLPQTVTVGETAVVPTVPEPATWALLILGVAMIGFAARRQGAALAV